MGTLAPFNHLEKMSYLDMKANDDRFFSPKLQSSQNFNDHPIINRRKDLGTLEQLQQDNEFIGNQLHAFPVHPKSSQFSTLQHAAGAGSSTLQHLLGNPYRKREHQPAGSSRMSRASKTQSKMRERRIRERDILADNS